MKGRLTPALLVAAVLAASQFALWPNKIDAQQAATSSNTIPLSQLTRQLEDAGYTDITKIDVESRTRVEFEGRTIHGNEFELFLDPTSREITRAETDFLPASELIKQLEDAGFTTITKLETEPFHRYEVSGRNAAGSKFEAFINRATGEIKEDR